MTSEYLVITTTTETPEDASRLAEEMVRQRLAACAQVEGPITSTFRWQGKIEQGQEWKCSLKTSTALYDQVETALKQAHPYETPEILALPVVRGSRDYLDWMDDELKVNRGGN